MISHWGQLWVEQCLTLFKKDIGPGNSFMEYLEIYIAKYFPPYKKTKKTIDLQFTVNTYGKIGSADFLMRFISFMVNFL